MTGLLGSGAYSAESMAQTLALGLLLGARLLPIAWLVPWLGVSGGPAVLPLLSTLALAVGLWPVVVLPAEALPLSLLPLLPFALRELAIGLVYAFALGLPVFALQWSGAWINRAYATLQRTLFICVFFALGGHRVAISALGEGLLRRPIGSLDGFKDPLAVALGSARLFADAFAVALLLALPILAALALTELFVLIATRSASALAFGLALRPGLSAIALFVTGIGITLWIGAAPDALHAWLLESERLWDTL